MAKLTSCTFSAAFCSTSRMRGKTPSTHFCMISSLSGNILSKSVKDPAISFLTIKDGSLQWSLIIPTKSDDPKTSWAYFKMFSRTLRQNDIKLPKKIVFERLVCLFLINFGRFLFLHKKNVKNQPSGAGIQTHNLFGHIKKPFKSNTKWVNVIEVKSSARQKKH